MTPPRAACSSSHSPIASSHGCRSTSSRAWPAVILAMLAGGWKSSASANGTPRRWASAAPTVDLPEPDTPITTIGDFIPSTYSLVLVLTDYGLIVILLQAEC